MARSHTPRTRYSTPLAMLAPLEIRPLRDQSMLLVGDLSTIFGIELIEPAARAAAVSHDAMDVKAVDSRRTPPRSPRLPPRPAGAVADRRRCPERCAAAVAAWKALPEGAIVTCARGRRGPPSGPAGA